MDLECEHASILGKRGARLVEPLWRYTFFFLGKVLIDDAYSIHQIRFSRKISGLNGLTF
jgi:hypothetical protein